MVDAAGEGFAAQRVIAYARESAAASLHRGDVVTIVARMNAGTEKFSAVASDAGAGGSALAAAGRFLRQFWLAVLAISVAILTPCFWHRHIEAGDLPSHVYNAWLVQLIERGQAPGLYVIRQWTNVLFDEMLTGFGALWGLRAGEKIATGAAVLIFFWGAFALICAMSRRIVWFVLPAVAMIAYGWTFEMGFMNFYISLGCAFFALAIFARGKGRERFLGVALVPLILLAHPLGFMFLFAAGAYMAIRESLSPRRQLYLLAASGLLLVVVRLYLAGHYKVLWPVGPIYFFNGADQLLLFGPQYRLPADLLLAFAVCCLVTDVVSRRTTPGAMEAYRLPLELYGIAFLAGCILPDLVQSLMPPEAPVSFLVQRLTSVTAVFACGLLGTMKPRRWHLAGFAAIAVLFFFNLYRDTGRIDRMETQVEQYESLLPPGQHVVARIWPFLGGRVFIDHIVDRACINRCISYGNYEPSTAQFRVRAKPGNPIVAAKYDDTNDIPVGNYVVQPQDLPLFEIYQCNLNRTDLCMHELGAGETTGEYGINVEP